ILGVVVLATGVGVAATRVVKPKYEVSARLMIMSDPVEQAKDPLRSMGLLQNDDWTELLKSFRVADGVVRKLTLFLQTQDASDRDLFHGFTVDDDGYLPSKYELVIDRGRKR